VTRRTWMSDLPYLGVRRKQLATPLLIVSVACLFVGGLASASEDEDRQQSNPRDGLVYGIDLSQRENNAGTLKETGDLQGSHSRLYDCSEYLRKEQPFIVGGGLLLLLILVNYFAVTQAYHGRATYFADYGDVFWFCLPVAATLLTKGFVWWVLGDIRLGSEVVKVCLVFACAYNLTRPLVDNRHAPLFSAMSICISRFTLGYFLILAMVYTLMGMHPAKQTDESNVAYEIRKQTATIRGAAILTGVGFLIRGLVGRAQFHDRRDYDDAFDR